MWLFTNFGFFSVVQKPGETPDLSWSALEVGWEVVSFLGGLHGVDDILIAVVSLEDQA
jgi:hypothetical protein